MNSAVIVVLMVIAFLAARRRPVPIGMSGARIAMIFLGVLMMHVVVIAGLMAYHHLKHF
jgi:hypothetical protein